jgi:hypothetical protein
LLQLPQWSCSRPLFLLALVRWAIQRPGVMRIARG